MKDKFQLTFDKSAAGFIMECFPQTELLCLNCGDTIGCQNLGGVIAVNGRPCYVCSNTLCLLEVAQNHVETAVEEVGA